MEYFLMDYRSHMALLVVIYGHTLLEIQVPLIILTIVHAIVVAHYQSLPMLAVTTTVSLGIVVPHVLYPYFIL